MSPITQKSLLDIIKEENVHRDPHAPKDKSTWKTLRDKLRLKRAGAAWTSSVRIPTSDIPIHNNRRASRRNLVRYDTISTTVNPSELTPDHFDEPSMSSSIASDQPPAPLSRPQFSRRTSACYDLKTPTLSGLDDSSDSTPFQESIAPTRSFRPQMSRHNSTRFSSDHNNNFTDPPEPGHYHLSGAQLGEERTLSAREAVAAQEAAEAEAAAAESDEEGEEEEGGGDTEGIFNTAATAEPVKMSLMDLLEETDKKMGFEVSIYTMGDGDDFEEEEENEEKEGEVNGRVEYDCCVCMVRHGGAASTPCGHTFCRLCSKELRAGRGTCPLCNDFILEILDVF